MYIQSKFINQIKSETTQTNQVKIKVYAYNVYSCKSKTIILPIAFF